MEPSHLSSKPAATFLTARWVHLVMLNYEVDPAVLLPRVPAGVELDDWQGRTLVSMVGFQFLDTRVLGVPIPFHRNFEEVNLRFYVRRHVGEEVRRGVVFVQEIVPRAAIAWVANVLYNESYVAFPMWHEDRIGNGDGDGRGDETVTYGWKATRSGPEARLGATISGPPFLPEEGSEEEFITEHYWGYVAQRDGSTVEYRVEHPQWRVWNAENPEFTCDVSELYGPEFVAGLRGEPRSCFVAEGSEIKVRRGRRI